MMPIPLSPVLAVVLQAAGWVAPTMAISLVFIALSFVGIAIGLMAVAKNAVELLEGLRKEIGELREELHPAIKSMQTLAEEGSALAGKVQQEIHEVVRTSQRVRFDVERGMAQARRRFSDLDALAEVVQEEIEDTALDVTARLRSVRRGLNVVGRVRGLMGGGRRRKRVRVE